MLRKQNAQLFSGSDVDHLTETELMKAIAEEGLVVFEEDNLLDFVDSVDKIIKKGQSSLLDHDELDIIEKAQKDISKLTKKIITDKAGHQRAVYVKTDSGNKKFKTGDKVSVRVSNAHVVEGEYHSPNKMNGAAGYHITHDGKMMSPIHEIYIKRSKNEESNQPHKNLTDDNTPSGFYKKHNQLATDAIVAKIQGNHADTKKKLGNMMSEKQEPVGSTGASHEDAYDRHKHNMKVQRMGKEASLKHIEAKYGEGAAKHVREKHETGAKKISSAVIAKENEKALDSGKKHDGEESDETYTKEELNQSSDANTEYGKYMIKLMSKYKVNTIGGVHSKFSDDEKYKLEDLSRNSMSGLVTINEYTDAAKLAGRSVKQFDNLNQEQRYIYISKVKSSK